VNDVCGATPIMKLTTKYLTLCGFLVAWASFAVTRGAIAGRREQVTIMKHIWLMVVLLGCINSAAAQVDTPLVPPEQDQRDLFARAAPSRLVIIGKVVKSEGSKRQLRS